jgi:hypothetical protein
MSFDAYITLWRFETPFGTSTPKMGVHLGVWRFIHSHSFALLGTCNVTLKLPFWPTPLQALVLVASPRLGLQYTQPTKGKKCLEENNMTSKPNLRKNAHNIYETSTND